MKKEKANLPRGGEQYTLFTNLREVGYNNVRLFCHAVLLSEISVGPLAATYTIRGFGTEAAWDNWKIHLSAESFPYTLEPFESKTIQLLRESGRTEPLHVGNILTLADGLKFQLYSSDNTQPIDIHTQNGDINKVWEILADKTREYWTGGPYMPNLIYGPARIRARNFI